MFLPAKKHRGGYYYVQLRDFVRELLDAYFTQANYIICVNKEGEEVKVRVRDYKIADRLWLVIDPPVTCLELRLDKEALIRAVEVMFKKGSVKPISDECESTNSKQAEGSTESKHVHKGATGRGRCTNITVQRLGS